MPLISYISIPVTDPQSGAITYHRINLSELEGAATTGKNACSLEKLKL